MIPTEREDTSLLESFAQFQRELLELGVTTGQPKLVVEYNDGTTVTAPLSELSVASTPKPEQESFDFEPFDDTTLKAAELSPILRATEAFKELQDFMGSDKNEDIVRTVERVKLKIEELEEALDFALGWRHGAETASMGVPLSRNPYPKGEHWSEYVRQGCLSGFHDVKMIRQGVEQQQPNKKKKAASNPASGKYNKQEYKNGCLVPRRDKY